MSPRECRGLPDCLHTKIFQGQDDMKDCATTFVIPCIDAGAAMATHWSMSHSKCQGSCSEAAGHHAATDNGAEGLHCLRQLRQLALVLYLYKKMRIDYISRTPKGCRCCSKGSSLAAHASLMLETAGQWACCAWRLPPPL
eukprot:scaffold200789_cov36-Prasinocladus_malaysianus.AAC.2